MDPKVNKEMMIDYSTQDEHYWEKAYSRNITGKKRKIVIDTFDSVSGCSIAVLFP
jgi:hypothetical protein